MIFFNDVVVYAICTLANFNNLPQKIEGRVVMETKSFLVLRIENKDKTQTVEVTVAKEKCEVKK